LKNITSGGLIKENYKSQLGGLAVTNFLPDYSQTNLNKSFKERMSGKNTHKMNGDFLSGSKDLLL